MAHNPDPAQAPDSAGRRPKSTWIVIGILALLLGVLALQGAIGVAVWFFLTGLFLLLTVLYALVFRRRTWATLLTGKQRKVALAGSGVMMILGVVAGAIAAPQRQQPAADDQTRPSNTSSPSDRSSSPSSPPPTSSDPVPTSEEASIAGQPCTDAEQTRRQGKIEYRCTQNSDGQLIWLDKETSERVTEARKAAEQKAAEDRAAAEKAAAEEQQRAEQKAAEERAAAEKAAAEAQQREEQERKAAQEEADRLAAEREAEAERQRQADAEAQRQAEEAQRQAEEAQRQAEEARRLEQAEQQPVPPGNVYYENCDAVRAAGAAPIHPGDPGWQPKFDRNDNGVGCEDE